MGSLPRHEDLELYRSYPNRLVFLLFELSIDICASNRIESSNRTLIIRRHDYLLLCSRRNRTTDNIWDRGGNNKRAKERKDSLRSNFGNRLFISTIFQPLICTTVSAGGRYRGRTFLHLCLCLACPKEE